jgi:hypothetical protein
VVIKDQDVFTYGGALRDSIRGHFYDKRFPRYNEFLFLHSPLRRHHACAVHDRAEDSGMVDEGEIDFPTEDVFFDKYDVVKSREESGFIDKDNDNWDFITKFANDNPDKIWSVYDCGEIVCGLYLIDVNGYYITVQSGNIGEIYGYSEGMVA